MLHSFTALQAIFDFQKVHPKTTKNNPKYCHL